MTKASIAGGVFTIVLLLAIGLTVSVVGLSRDRDVAQPAVSAAAVAPASASPAREAAATAEVGGEGQQGFLFGRVTTVDGVTYQGRLRWGKYEEAFWDDHFNGVKKSNPWASQVAPERLPTERHSLSILGLEIHHREREVDLTRPFLTRFGDLTRIEARGRDVLVTLKSGTVFELDRLNASDFDDGLRVWDAERGVIDLDSLLIRSVELLPTAEIGATSSRLHGTVRTPQGDFTGFLQWGRQDCLASDLLSGRSAEGEVSLSFETVRSIARHAREGVIVTLRDGRELELSVVHGASRGISVDDSRYGRVLVSWDSFELVDLSPVDGANLVGSGSAYGDFPAGQPLRGTVTTHDGRVLTGRLVYDLDESETTETLDAPWYGVDYTIPFGAIAFIVVPADEEPATLLLVGGEELRLERRGDLGPGNAGVLVFVEGVAKPEYVPWVEVARIELG